MFIFLLSLFIVALGQPATSYHLSLVSALVGPLLFFISLNGKRPKEGFLLGVVWFALIQAIQLRWMISHPYLYIYGVIALLSLLMGLQWGAIATLMTRLKRGAPLSLSVLCGHSLFLAALWTLLEWSRLFFLSGFPFNPIGLSLSASPLSAQLASIGGIYFLSFILIFIHAFTALSLSHVLPNKRKGALFLCLLFSASPYLIGGKLYQEKKELADHHPKIQTLLLQTAFPIEETTDWQSTQEAVSYAFYEWEEIFKLASPYSNRALDLVVIPENVVPFKAYLPLFPLSLVQEKLFKIAHLEADSYPPLAEPLAYPSVIDGQSTLFVSHAFIAQALSNFLKAPLIIGLEDSSALHPQLPLKEPSEEKKGKEKVRYYSSALLFKPYDRQLTKRISYDKKVLVPMGEYIPFFFLKELAASYGIHGSYSSGTKPALIQVGSLSLGVSICYEEAYPHLVRAACKRGCNLLVNLTNDGWYPDSSLPQQHFSLARMRCIENGVSSVRATNTGVTASIDPLGHTIAALPDGANREALLTSVSLHTLPTLYKTFGDWPLMLFSLLAVIFRLLLLKLRPLA